MRSTASKTIRVVGSAAALGLGYFLLLPNFVFSQAPFYQGKTITVIHGSAPGGTGDMMVKAALPHLKKHVPGEPTIVSECMPGAGGIKAVKEDRGWRSATVAVAITVLDTYNSCQPASPWMRETANQQRRRSICNSHSPGH